LQLSITLDLKGDLAHGGLKYLDAHLIRRDHSCFIDWWCSENGYAWKIMLNAYLCHYNNK